MVLFKRRFTWIHTFIHEINVIDTNMSKENNYFSFSPHLPPLNTRVRAGWFFSVPTAFEYKKFKQIILQQAGFGKGMLHSFESKAPFVGPCHLPNFRGKKPKATTKVTLRATKYI